MVVLAAVSGLSDSMSACAGCHTDLTGLVFGITHCPWSQHGIATFLCPNTCQNFKPATTNIHFVNGKQNSYSAWTNLSLLIKLVLLWDYFANGTYPARRPQKLTLLNPR